MKHIFVIFLVIINSFNALSQTEEIHKLLYNNETGDNYLFIFGVLDQDLIKTPANRNYMLQGLEQRMKREAETTHKQINVISKRIMKLKNELSNDNLLQGVLNDLYITTNEIYDLLTQYISTLDNLIKNPGNKNYVNELIRIRKKYDTKCNSLKDTFYTSAVIEQKKQGSKYNYMQVSNISSRLCSDLYRSNTVGFDKNRVIKIIADGLGVDQNNENINKIVSDFLNDNKQNLICNPDKAAKDNRFKLYYKSAMLKGITDLFDEILLNDDEFSIEFNMYEIIDNKKETLLDYIDKLIASNHYDKEELQMIQMDIEDLGGKRGIDLK